MPNWCNSNAGPEWSVYGTCRGRAACRLEAPTWQEVAFADPQIAALAGERLVERVSAERRAGRDLVPLAKRCPALDENVRLQHAARPDHHVRLDHAEFADAHARPDDGVGMHARSRGHDGRWID